MAINLPNYERQTQILNNTNEILDIIPSAGKTPRRKEFAENGVWVAPVGVTRVFVTGGGAGGGGASVSSSGTGSNGSTGGSTSFGTLLTLIGGGGGTFGANNTSVAGSRGGSGGEPGHTQSLFSGTNSFGAGDGGSSGYFKGGTAAIVSSASTAEPSQINGDLCSGGAGIVVGPSNNTFAPGGGGGMFVHQKELTVVPGTSYTITIGKGGTGAVSGSLEGGNGGDGILIIEWWE